MAVQVTKQAPDFTLEGVVRGDITRVSLSDYDGKWVVLFFYPLDFTFVCPTELSGFNEVIERFRKLDAQLLAVSVDSVHAHLAWQQGQLGPLEFPQLSDLTREVSQAYGVLLEDKGYSLRGLFIIDPQGILKYMVIHDENIGRSVDETLRVLEALQTGELCPLGWRPGEKTLGKG
jgi:peroxiredoxin (alkyl hydroperoxide reductase subunit C)